MSDPRAGLIIAAEDTTAAAFNSANKNLNALESNVRRASGGLTGSFRNFGQAVLSVRNVLAGLGVVLSARALGHWIADATRSEQVTREQAEAFEGAKDALAELNAVLQARSLPLLARFADLIERSAEGWRQFLAPTELEEKRRALNAIYDDIAKRQAGVENANVAKVFFGATPAELQAQIAELKEKARQALDEIIDLQRNQAPPFQLFDFDDVDKAAIDDKTNILSQILAEQTKKALDEQEHLRDLQEALALEPSRVAEEERKAAADQEREEFERQERRRELLEQHVDDIKLNLMTEVEYEAEMFARRQEQLDEWLAQDASRKQQHAQMSVELANQTERRIGEIRKREQQREQQLRLMQIGGVANMFAAIAAITSVGAEDSKKKFETHKKLATAAAIVDTYASVAYALRNPPGPPFSIPQAVAAGLFGFAQVKAIQSTTWSGGAGGFGAAGGGGGGEVAAPIPNDRTAGLISGDGSGGRGGTIINVTITPGIMGRVDPESARIVARAIGDEMQNGDFEFIPRGSRQVMTIRGDGVQDESRP